MTLLGFRNLVQNMCSRYGIQSPGPTDVANLNALLQEGLNVYAKETEVLGTTQNTFTPIVGQSIYQTYNPAYSDAIQDTNSGPVRLLAKPMCSVTDVFLNGSPLYVASEISPAIWFNANPRAMIWAGCETGESSEADIIRLIPGYLSAINGLPQFWFQKAPNVLAFSQPFDQVYSQCWFSGVNYHSPLLTDNQVLDFPDEDYRPAARLCRNLLLESYSLEVAGPLMAESKAEMAMRKGQSSSRNVGHSQRGGLTDYAFGAARLV